MYEQYFPVAVVFMFQSKPLKESRGTLLQNLNLSPRWYLLLRFLFRHMQENICISPGNVFLSVSLW